MIEHGASNVKMTVSKLKKVAKKRVGGPIGVRQMCLVFNFSRASSHGLGRGRFLFGSLRRECVFLMGLFNSLP
jgi:hypothetical protein